MKNHILRTVVIFTITCAIGISNVSLAQQLESVQASAAFNFDGNIANTHKTEIKAESAGEFDFGIGLEGKSLKVNPVNERSFLAINSDAQKFNNQKDFSVQFWLKTQLVNDKRAIIMSTKKVTDYSLASQKEAGWSMSVANGTLAWNVGSGKRRLSYLRENGKRLPLNDGLWHLLALTFNSSKQEFRLYYDGINKAIYKIGNKDNFNFESENSLTVGWNGKAGKSTPAILPQIKQGAGQLQVLLDEFNKLGLGDVKAEEFIDLIVDPEELFQNKTEAKKKSLGTDTIQFLEDVAKTDLKILKKKRSALMDNPYTVYQVRNFMIVAPLLQIYSLNNGKVVIDKDAARQYTKAEELSSPDFELDNLTIWDRELPADEVAASYSKHFKLETKANKHKKKELISAVWNIWHGGKHNTIEKDGFDSRMRIVEMLQKENADVIMMQETYSSGDFIAAELGYYFATTADWDYLNQGSNISVLSRYPIKEVYVPKDASFMNVGTKVELSKGQEIWVMSNWYGMQKFPEVFDFHQSRFDNADKTPVLFGGDFNAVPHTDGGKSPASKKMLEAGFTDAYRSFHKEVENFPGFTHRGGHRIDQLYFKGANLKHKETKVISTWETGFPSDHYLILSRFGLK